MPKVYFFGCANQPGHYMYDLGMRIDWTFMCNNPWGLNIDWKIAPKDGSIGLAQKNGWTVISFIDFTGDQRPGSNSAFLAQGNFSLDEMRALATQHFPELAKRIPQARKEGIPVRPAIQSK